MKTAATVTGCHHWIHMKGERQWEMKEGLDTHEKGERWSGVKEGQYEKQCLSAGKDLLQQKMLF